MEIIEKKELCSPLGDDLRKHILREGARTFLTLAKRELRTYLEQLTEKNIESVKPWIYLSSVDEVFEKIEKGERIALLLWSSAEQSLMGVINMNNPVYGGLWSAYLGYWIGADYSNKGFMAEGMSLVFDYAFNELKFHRLEANIQPGNLPSKKLVQKLGFKLEGFSPKYLKINGEWRDHERWAIIADDWQNASV